MFLNLLITGSSRDFRSTLGVARTLETAVATVYWGSLSSPYWMLGHVILSINSAKTCTCTKACIGVITINCQVVENER